MIKEAVRADVVRVKVRREGKDRKSHVGQEEAPGCCLPRDGTAHSGLGIQDTPTGHSQLLS